MLVLVISLLQLSTRHIRSARNKAGYPISDQIITDVTPRLAPANDQFDFAPGWSTFVIFLP